MTKKFYGLVLGGLLSAASLFAGNLRAGDDDLFAACMNNVKKDCQSWAVRGGGSDVPRGLTNDSKAELAIGEKYILTGLITISSGDPYLRIDFNQQPWLASAIRLRNPFYRINDAAVNWKSYQGKTLTIVATAHYSAWADGQDRTILEIYLQPSDQPVITGLQPSQSVY